METCNLNIINKEKEYYMIKQILCYNKYDISILNKSTKKENKIKQKCQKPNRPSLLILVKKQNLLQDFSKIPP